MSKCRGCSEPVEWGIFASGNRAPFDLDEAVTKEGETRWVLESDTLGLQPPPPLQARRATVGERGVTCHFATCPHSSEFRGTGSPL